MSRSAFVRAASRLGEAGEPEALPAVAPWPELDEAALHGLAGRYVRAIEPHTEADPVALLAQFLVAFGSVVGSGAWFRVEADRHHPNLFAVVVAPSAKGRKGTSWRHVRRLFCHVDDDFDQRTETGLSSGEGLIHRLRDAAPPRPGTREGAPAVVDEGVEDKRLLVVESEFASVLRVLAREGNTLSAVIRNAWDGSPLATLTRKDAGLRATGAHVAIIGHVTAPELVDYLTATESANGFGNRFLWFAARRSKMLPLGGEGHRLDLDPIVRDLRAAVASASAAGEIGFDAAARRAWVAAYPTLSRDRFGLVGSVTSRAEAQALRLALLYALLDCAHSIRPEHLAAAVAVWDYAERSAMRIFGDSLGDPVADEILAALRRAPDGMRRSEIREHFARNVASARIGRALALLAEAGLAERRVERETGGRPAEIWTSRPNAIDAGNARSGGDSASTASTAYSGEEPRG